MAATAADPSTMAGMPARLEPEALEKLKAMRTIQPLAFAAEIERAMSAAHGRIPDAAAILRVSERQLYRWFEQEKDLLARIPRAHRGRPSSTKERT